MAYVFHIEQFDDQFGNGTLSHCSNFGNDFFTDPIVAMLELQRLPFAGLIQRYKLLPGGHTISAGVPYRKYSENYPDILTNYWEARCKAYGMFPHAKFLHAGSGTQHTSGVYALDESGTEIFASWSEVQKAEGRFHALWYQRYERRRTVDNPDGIGTHSRPQHILYAQRPNYDIEGKRIMSLAPSSIPALYGAALEMANHFAFHQTDDIWDRLSMLWYLKTLRARGLETITPSIVLSTGWNAVVRHLRDVYMPIDSPEMKVVRAELAEIIQYGTGNDLPHKAGRFMVAVRQMSTRREHVAGHVTPLMDRVYMSALKLRDEQDTLKNRKALVGYARALQAVL